MEVPVGKHVLLRASDFDQISLSLTVFELSTAIENRNTDTIIIPFDLFRYP
jgi:hypothetical protein